ncbi:MAG TPA: putative holin-like toxin [Bacilli bacterium]|nr:putative holin-like toxin [Bacilli bacterium]
METKDVLQLMLAFGMFVIALFSAIFALIAILVK